MSRRSKSLFIAGLSLTALVATACSSSGKGGTGTSTPPTTGTGASTSAGSGSSSAGGGAATGSVVKIGFLLAETGPYASSSQPGLAVAQAWASYVNANGGIAGGHQVQIVDADSKGDATAGQAGAKKLVEQDKVAAIIVGDPVAEYAVEPYLSGINIAKLSESGYAPQWHTTAKWFETSNNSSVAQGETVPAGVALGAKTFAMAVCSEVASCQATGQSYTIPLAQKLGMKSGGFLKVSESQTDFTAACLAIKQRGVDYLYFSIPPAAAGRMSTQCIAQGYTGYFGGSATGWDAKTFRDVKNGKFAGGIDGFPWWVSDAPVQTFRDAMAKYQPSANFGNSASTATWTTLELLRKALSNTTGAVTTDTVLSALYTVKNETLGGLLPQPITFTAGQPSPDVNCFWTWKMNGGDANPTSLPIPGASGNGQTGGLKSTCLPLTLK